MEPPETVEVDAATVRCEGIGGALGHPAVYLTLVAAEAGAEAGQPRVDCPYCGRRFSLRQGAKVGPAH